MTLIAGIDEAGRGPVLGPLVLAVVSATPKIIKEFEKLGITDSKQLTEFKRDEFFKKIKEIADYKIKSIKPKQIDAALISQSNNLNKLEQTETAKLLQKIKFDTCYIDLPGRDARSYTMGIRKIIGKDHELIAENKADAKYAIVGAASVLAKVTRDREIEKIKEKIGIDFGSGYPSDPKTKAFIKEHWNNKDFNFIRHTWQTCKTLKAQHEQKSLGSFN